MIPLTALVTGASAGLGEEFARLLAKDHHNLILVARNEQRLQQLADELRQRYEVTVHIFACDLSRPGAAQELYDAVRAADLTIDIAEFTTEIEAGTDT